MTKSASPNTYYQGPASDHFDGTCFFNPGSVDGDRSLGQLLRWRFGGTRRRWPDDLPTHPADKPPPRVGDGRCRIAFVGHATFLIQVDDLNILVDPVWSRRASPVAFAGPERKNPPGIAFADLPPVDAVLVSHNHYDHLDVATLHRLWSRDRPRVVAPLGNASIIRAGRPGIAVETADWGASVPLSPRTRVHFVPTHHWSARGIGDRRHALWAAFVIETPGGGIYAVGDSGFAGGETFAAVGRAHPDLRVALLPIGAYEPRWFMEPHHMNPAEAVAAFRLCGARQAIAHHWGTFQLTDESYADPPRELALALAAAAIEPSKFQTMPPGAARDDF